MLEALLFPLFLLNLSLDVEIEGPILLGPIITGYGLYYYKEIIFTRQYTKIYKSEVVGEIINIYFNNTIKFEHRQQIGKLTFEESKLYKSPNKYDGEDKLKGLLHELPFECSEITAIHRVRKNDGTYRDTDIFSGLFIAIEFNKIIKNPTIVKIKNAGSFINSILGNSNLNSSVKGMDKIELDNPEFRDKYDIYSFDEVESRYVLTQALMERMLILSNSFGLTEYSFVGNKMYIAVETDENFFESHLDTSLNNISEVVRYIEIIEDIGSIVDVLKIDEYLWSKEKE